jgi:hypothetical protein
MACLPGSVRRAAGYSLIEVTVSMGIMMAVMASTLTLLRRVQLGFVSEGERTDLQQKVRVAGHTMYEYLVMAGGGPYQGVRGGRLDAFFPTVLPFRQIGANPDPAGTFRTDTLTIMYVQPGTPAQTTIGQPLSAQSGWVTINLDRGCPPDDSACGFTAGMDVVVYDDTAGYDTFRVASVQPGLLQLQHTMIDSARQYAAGATIVETVNLTFYLKPDPATSAYKLMRDDGVNAGAVLIDHAVDLTFAYYGEPEPPRLTRPITDLTGPWTTYGPRPPPINVQSTAYAPGENCVFQMDADGMTQIPRLALLGTGGTTTLVALTASALTDGPWCPDASSANRVDADLLRIRKIAVTLRLQASEPALRGPAGALFAHGGTSRDANRWVPDQEIRFEVSPRNFGR